VRKRKTERERERERERGEFLLYEVFFLHEKEETQTVK